LTSIIGPTGREDDPVQCHHRRFPKYGQVFFEGRYYDLKPRISSGLVIFLITALFLGHGDALAVNPSAGLVKPADRLAQGKLRTF
jgi:hypothetical protein